MHWRPAPRLPGSLHLPRRRPRGTPADGIDRRLAALGLIVTLLPLVLFLLPFFSASGECCGAHDRPPLPRVRAAADIDEPGPLVEVLLTGIQLNGDRLGRELDPLGELQRGLRGLRAVRPLLHPELAGPERAYLMVDRRLPCVIVGPVLRAMTDAGYPTISLVVERVGPW